jgi:hypothetical protein
MCNEIYPSTGEDAHANADAAMKVAIVLEIQIEIELASKIHYDEEKLIMRLAGAQLKTENNSFRCCFNRKMSCRSNCSPSLFRLAYSGSDRVYQVPA